jgi:DNA-entry nuclease
MKKKFLTLSAVCLVSLSLLFTGCAQSQQKTDGTEPDNRKTSTQSAKKDTKTNKKNKKENTKSDKTKTNNKNESSASVSRPKESAKTSDSALAKLKYTGKAYKVINNNNPNFKSDLLKKTSSYEKYGKLDKLGRCTTCIARIGKDLMPSEPRGSIGMIKPTGWHTIRYDFIDGKYLYNRCHLIGYQLTGETTNERNLITGTRYLNIDGMLSFENEAAEYIKNTGNHVLYRVTPIYKGNELLARGVHMEAKSVEDKGKGVKFNVYCFNAEPGVKINYKTGDSAAADGSKGKSVKTGYGDNSARKSSSSSSDSAAKKSESAKTSDSDSSGSSKATYVLNTNTMKFHLPDCSSVTSMTHKKTVKSTRAALIKEGYEPCGRCHP